MKTFRKHRRKSSPAAAPSANHDSQVPFRALADEPQLKVCVLAACPFPANHGTPGSIRELVEATAERGHEVHVVTYHIGEPIPVRGVHLHRIPQLTRERDVIVGPTVRKPLYDLQMVAKAIEVIRRFDLDLINAHGYESMLVGRLCKLMTGLPVLYSAHNRMADELGSYDFIRPRWAADALGRLLDAVVPRMADRIVPHSENLSNFLRNSGLHARVAPIVNFGIDLDKIPALSDELKDRYQLTRPVILYSGVIDRFQRIDLLLEAMVPVTLYEPDATLLIVTTIPNPPLVAELQAQTQRLGIEKNVVITEPQSLENARALLALCDVGVSPRPQTPGFPIKVLNYLAARRPCAMFASSNSRLTHGENVFLAAHDTGQALGEAIVELLRDSELRTQIAHGGFQYLLENHDRRLIARQLVGEYMTSLATAGRLGRLANRPRLEPLPAGIHLLEPSHAPHSHRRKRRGKTHAEA